ncbi:MAG: permease-like cell division protein FtsX [Clostridiales bacterium]|jgi:cell division transport system permease protein|nr:permease-like cell division protein FtsX [Clostridiales bacterium]
MRISSLKFYLFEAFDNLIKNKLMAFASIAIVSSSILVFSISFYLARNINYILTQFNNSIGLSVILNDDLNENDISKLYDKISKIRYISNVKFISGKNGLKKFLEEYENAHELLEEIENDKILPDSFDIDLKDNRYYGIVIDKLENLKIYGVERVKHARDEIDMLMSIRKVIKITSTVIILILSLISVLIVINTIQLAVNLRREEIKIMKYIGATNWFIRWPFIIEGIIIGLTGSIIPVLITWPCYSKLIIEINNKYPTLKNIFEFMPGIIIFSALMPIAICLGIFIGIIASAFCIKKYLNV